MALTVCERSAGKGCSSETGGGYAGHSNCNTTKVKYDGKGFKWNLLHKKGDQGFSA